MSYFSSQMTAAGYAKHRPYFHPLVIDKIKSYLNLKEKVNNALDVGCGTGLSTVALAALAGQVVGIDNSQEMINAAVRQENIHYYAYPAEDLPFPDASFDLITVCGALNWIDRPPFFTGAARVLSPAGWMIVYDNFIQGRMKENPAFELWYTHEFLEKYPKPPRDERPLTSAECRQYGFHFAHQETYTNEIVFSNDQCIDYLMTQSNITARVTQGLDTTGNIRQWLTSSLTPLFDSSPRTLLFGGYIWYLQQI